MGPRLSYINGQTTMLDGPLPRIVRLGLLAEIRLALSFLTRLPVRLGAEATAPLSSSVRAFPLVGALIGAAGATVLWIAGAIGLAGFPAALLALGAIALLTGALHEDGLADTADGLGARGDVAARLAVMKDSRIGGFGALALVFAVGLKMAALARLPAPIAALALIATGAYSRALVGALMQLPAAKTSGLAWNAGEPPRGRALSAMALGLIALGLCLAPIAAAAAAIAGATGALALAWIAIKNFGGQTGDTLGAAQQAAETAALLAVSAILGAS